MAKSRHYYIRKTHRWLGLILGIQFLMWTIGGLYFSWSDIDEVHGDFQKRNARLLSAQISLVSPTTVLDTIRKAHRIDSVVAIQLIEIFLKQVPEAIEKLNVHIPKREWKETHAVAHKLKSSIAIFEFQELKKLITNIEEYARDGERLEEIPHLYADFKEGSKIAVRNLEAELGKLRQLVSKMH